MHNEQEFDLLQYYNRSDKNVLLTYKGPFDKDVLSVIGNYIKVVIGGKSEGKKMFKIFLELAEIASTFSKVKNASAEYKLAGEGTIVLLEYEHYYQLITGNIIRSDDAIPLIERCELINSLDVSSLREYKRRILQLPEGAKEEQDIRLVKAALTSSNPLGFEIYSLDGSEDLISISTRIEKKEGADEPETSENE